MLDSKLNFSKLAWKQILKTCLTAQEWLTFLLNLTKQNELYCTLKGQNSGFWPFWVQWGQNVVSWCWNINIFIHIHHASGHLKNRFRKQKKKTASSGQGRISTPLQTEKVLFGMPYLFRKCRDHSLQCSIPGEEVWGLYRTDEAKYATQRLIYWNNLQPSDNYNGIFPYSNMGKFICPIVNFLTVTCLIFATVVESSNIFSKSDGQKIRHKPSIGKLLGHVFRSSAIIQK